MATLKPFSLDAACAGIAVIVVVRFGVAGFGVAGFGVAGFVVRFVVVEVVAMATPTPTEGGFLSQLPEGVVTHVATGPDSLSQATALLLEFGLPDGLLPLQDVVECGFNKETGYVWITQKKGIVHTFKQISKQVSYGDKITAYVEKGRLKKLTGVKAKELLWVSIVDIALMSDGSHLFFKSFTGLGKTFPASAFVKGADLPK